MSSAPATITPSSREQQARRRRVCLLLEGTYPYVSGGVSTWVHQIIEAMPEIDFSVHFIGDQKQHNAQFKYELPPNVTSLTESYLFDPLPDDQRKPGRGSRRRKREVLRMIGDFVSAEQTDERFDALFRLTEALQANPKWFTLADLAANEEIWEVLTAIYQRHAGDVSFLRYHSTVRDLTTILWRLVLTAGKLPEADCYHCVCTGYAGILGALASRLHGVPFLLSEHGVYLKERIEDIRKSTWLADGRAFYNEAAFQGELSAFKSLWIDFFDLLGRFAYSRADRITALYQGNARLQIEFGAETGKVDIIPNGIDTSRFADICKKKLFGQSDPARPVTVGFLGRVVPIKDVKTLLRAARLVGNRFPKTRFLIAGPTDEDPDYYEECLALTKQLGIESMVEFAGRMNPADFLEETDIMLLTSISEGLPFAVLEASAAGLPVVATDVGSCRELLTYPVREKDSPGPSGIVTEVANPGSTASALNQLVGSAELRRRLGRNGLERVEAAYRQEDIISRYRALYLETSAAGASASL